MKLIKTTFIVLALMTYVESHTYELKSIRASECPPEEVINKCGNMCEGTCQNGDFIVCPYICRRPQCMCKKGYYRSVSGRCVKPAECSKFQGDINNCIRARGKNARLAEREGECGNKMCLANQHVNMTQNSEPPTECYGFVGCICKENYMIYSDGLCHEADQCGHSR